MRRVAIFNVAEDDAAVVIAAAIGVALALAAGAIGAARARDDAGIYRFFGSEAGNVYGLRASVEPEPATRPLIVRARPAMVRQGSRRTPPVKVAAHPAGPALRKPPRLAAHRPATVPLPPVWEAALPGKPAIVSMYEDRTLRRGDAVMTAKGIRVFAGSRTFPYRPEDFRNIISARALELPFRKALMELDRAPAFAG